GWMLIATLIMQPVRMLRQGIDDLRAIDKQLTELRKVTGESLDVMNEYAHIANEVASRMGATTEEVIRQTTAWSRLGYNIQEASKLAEESVLLSTVGNMDIDKATTSLVSILKAFRIEADDARIAIDMINEVGKCLPSMLVIA
ncbi:MAG: phage tail tape measure protein, partial [Bacilli bacterium]